MISKANLIVRSICSTPTKSNNPLYKSLSNIVG
uniref:Uncharacterized protein n=1 Tax=Siphoviridae sp. ctF6o6 TaxID=2825402 RepID=A0A8S5QGG2_9CAUD|nr:MAG TPA: hypothetical protein [Siphoviridae sp. ctF6o6]